MNDPNQPPKVVEIRWASRTTDETILVAAKAITTEREFDDWQHAVIAARYTEMPVGWLPLIVVK